MKMNIRFITVLILAAFLTAACEDFRFCIEGQGSSVTQTLELDPFSGIEQSVSADVYISQGSEQSVEITGQQNIIDEIRLRVDNGVWKIDTRNGCFRNYEKLQIHITIPELTSAKVKGSGDIIGMTAFEVENLDLGISGSGNIELEARGAEIDASIRGKGEMRLKLDAQSLQAGISGSGNYMLEGSVKNQEIDIAGSGEVQAFDLETEAGQISITGSGKVEVYASQTLHVNIAGSGTVYYKGDAQISSEINGNGEVIDAN